MDQNVLLWINHGLAHPWADVLFQWLSLRVGFALPLLLGLLWLLVHDYEKSGAKLWLLMILVIVLGDTLGNLLKHALEQYRPCADFYLALRPLPGVRGPCGLTPTGMPSNHALNYFAGTAFLALVTQRRAMTAFLAVVALLVGISRIYLGKHYPSQVLVGSLLGITWGAAAALLSLRYLRFVQRVHRMREDG